LRMRSSVTVWILLITLLLAEGVHNAMAKEESILVTREMRQNAVANAERFEWAKRQRDRAVVRAQRWLEKSDEELWEFVPSPDTPRDAQVNRTGIGCPKCGKEQFTKQPYWLIDFENLPWKVKCNNCGEVFPKNDFEAYYKSGLDEHNIYQDGVGDRSLLFNTDHPDPNDPLHMYAVDDGLGYKQDDKRWDFAAYYGYRMWMDCIHGVTALARAYSLTDDAAYAHKAGVILARIADVYPDIDYNPQVHQKGFCISCGGSGKGRIQGCIWECFTADELALGYDIVYDAIKDDQELADFRNRMAEEHKLALTGGPADVCKHIEQNLLVEFAISVQDRRIHGNAGMHQRAMVATAIALDDSDLTPQYLDWVFAPDGGEVPTVLTDVICRDGLSYEAGIGYCSLPGRSLYNAADMLYRYGKYQRHDMYRDFPKFKKCFTMNQAARMLDQVNAKIGDSGKTQNWSGGGGLPLKMSMTGYRVYGELANAMAVGFSCSWDPARLAGDIYDAEPDAILERVKAEWKKRDRRLRSFNSGGYGLGVLQTAKADYGTAAYLYYGRSIFHGHEDRLSFGIMSKHVVMNPDLAYPQYTGHWPKRIGWVSHTVSHNTVMVNDKGQKRGWGGKSELFEREGPVRLIIADGGDVYDNVSTYKRALSLIDVSHDDSYVLDVFWARGGSNHRMINNGAAPDVTCTNLALERQATGTYAGPDVAFGEFYDGPENWDYDGSGFMYLYDVEKGKAALPFTIDWDLVDKRGNIAEGKDPHLRMYCLSEVDEVAIASGDPPRNSPGNPDSLRYIMRSRFGDELQTQFVTVHEPYEAQPFIKNVMALPIASHQGQGFVAAVQVELADGHRDVMILAEQPGVITAGDMTLDGRFGFVRLSPEGGVVFAKLVEGTSLAYGGFALSQSLAAFTGKLVSADDSDPDDVVLKLDRPLQDQGVSAQGLVGRYIIFDNAERSDASYEIMAVRDDNTISIGDMTLIERFVDPEQYDKGVVYNVVPGEAYRIHLSATWSK